MTSDAKIAAEDIEEDVNCYFLQPADSPYNLAERVQQANLDLLNSTPHSVRSTKVKFRDELVSFEPELTDDDVNSIESDQVEELPVSEEAPCVQPQEDFGYSTVLREGVDIYDIDEEVVVEELVLSDEELVNEVKVCEGSSAVQEGKKIETPSSSSGRKKTQPPPKDKKRHRPRPPKPQEVHCKEHCIEKVEADLSMSVRKLDIHEKLPRINLPPLQLHQRKCCDDIKLAQSDRNLPHYNGYRSEYGLTSRQIKNRNRHMEMIRQKETARQKLIEEYRALKVRQNEQVFCQWLREVSRRSAKDHKQRSSSEGGNKSERPKTAGFVPKTAVKKKAKRPTTTQSCVYIELSPSMLDKGVHIGDLLITNSKELSKKLHILTVN